MAVSFSPYAAYNAFVRLDAGGTPIVAHKWTVNVKTDDIDATNFEGAGYAEQITGMVSADVTIEFLYDSIRTPFGVIEHSKLFPSMSALGVNGYNYNVVELFPNAIANNASSFTFPQLTLLDVNVDSSVHDAIKVTLTCKSDGVFTYPD